MQGRRVWRSFVVGLVVGTGLALWRLVNLAVPLDVRLLSSAPLRRRWILPAAILAGCCWLGAATWSRLARLRDEPAARITYQYGVVGFGTAWGVAMTALRSIAQVRTLAPGAVPTWSLIVEVVLREAAIAFPFALWAGYVFGRVLTHFFRRLGVP